MKKGEYEKAMSYYENSLQIYSSHKDRLQVAKMKLDIGSLNLKRGDIYKAQEDIEFALTINLEFSMEGRVAETYHYLSLLYFEMANYHKAKDMIEKSYRLRSKLDNKVELAKTISVSILIHLVLENERMVKSRFEELEKINDLVESTRVENEYLLGVIKLLKRGKQSRVIDDIVSNELYEQILAKGLVEMEHTLYATLERCRYLLKEYRTSHQESTVLDLNLSFKMVQKYVIKQNSYKLDVELNKLKAEFAMENTDYKSALEYLENALKIAKEMGLFRLLAEVDKYKELIEMKIPLDASKIEQTLEQKRIADFKKKKSSKD